jgi:hypothetical protein
VAAAKALGDMSHMTYMPLGADKQFKNELLFLDIWNNLEGMGNFFSDAQVQAGADMVFAEREAIVWNALDGFLHFNFPAPTGFNDKAVGIIRGKVNSLQEAETIHNEVMEKLVNVSRSRGILSHHFYVRLAAPGSPEALEVLGLDVWMNGEDMIKHYTSPEYGNAGLNRLFAGKPTSSVWAHPKGQWVEW